MADLTYSAAAQTAIAYGVLFKAYSALTADEKALIDGTTVAPSATPGGKAKYALTMIQQWAQAFYQAGATAAPDVWEGLLVAETSAAVAMTLRAETERVRNLMRERERAWQMALDSFTLDDYAGATLTGQTITVKGIRFYVLSALAKMAKRRLVSSAAIDSETQWALNYLWNRTGWNFRRRQVRVRIQVVDFTGATWTNSSKTITKTGGFTGYTVAAGDRVRIISGTGAVAGDYIVASGTNDTVVLTTSIDSAADGQTDIAGSLVLVRMVGLGASETFDSIASQGFFYDDSTAPGSALVWADSGFMAGEKARLVGSGSGTGGRPRRFRTEERTDYKVWYFTPEPDQGYTLRGEVYIAGPGTPGSSTETTVFAKFPAEFRPIIRDLALGRVLTRQGMREEGEAVLSRAIEDVSALLPSYEDLGAPDKSPGLRDVNRDLAELGWGDGGGGIMLGGIQ